MRDSGRRDGIHATRVRLVSLVAQPVDGGRGAVPPASARWRHAAPRRRCSSRSSSATGSSTFSPTRLTCALRRARRHDSVSACGTRSRDAAHRRRAWTAAIAIYLRASRPRPIAFLVTGDCQPPSSGRGSMVAATARRTRARLVRAHRLDHHPVGGVRGRLGPWRAMK